MEEYSKSNGYSTSVSPMTALLDEPITAETTTAGQPTAITWRGDQYPVRVLMSWNGQLYRVATTAHGTPAIGEISRHGERWRLRHWWTS